MSSQQVNHASNKPTTRYKFGFFNAENLFLHFDEALPPHFDKMNEDQWQKLSSSVYESKPLKKCLEIAHIIKQKSPDIMMLCEIGGLESLNNFNQYFLNSEYRVYLIEGNSDRHIDVGFLVKKDFSYPILQLTHKERPLHFLYPHENQSKKTGYPLKAQTHYFSRDCAELRIYADEAAASPALIILLTHLKSRLDPERIDPGGTERRSAELRTCLEIYSELRQKYPQTQFIFAGDMNGYAGRSEPDEEFRCIYSETDLEDVLEVADVSIEKRSTFYQIKNSRTEGRQIDYCFISKQLQAKLIVSETEVYRYQDEFGFNLEAPKHLEDKLRLPSDHYPIFFSLENPFE